MFYEKIIEIIVYLLGELKNNKQLGEIDIKNLAKLGYTQNEINTAFSWVYSKIYSGEKIFSDEKAISHSHRFLHEVENSIIEPEAYGYLIQLHELGLLNDMDIEAIIDKVMISGYNRVSLDDMKTFIAGFLLDSEDVNNPSRRFTLNDNDTIN
ncbi:MAG: DUF494 family protein [Ignavibacteria bacterium]|jgi:uncharacterized protein Smg (DUF494 family)